MRPLSPLALARFRGYQIIQRGYCVLVRLLNLRRLTNGQLPLRAPLRIVGISLIAASLCSCSSSQPMGTWAINRDSACSSFTVSFPLERDTLQPMIGPHFLPRESREDRIGELQLSVHKCPQSIVSGRPDANQSFALVSVPLAEESASLSIAGTEPGVWVSLVLFVGISSGELSRLMRDSAFAVIEGRSSLIRKKEHGGERITADIGFENGKLSISALFACEDVPTRHTRMFVGTGTERYSLLFGETEGLQCSSSDVEMRLAGDTPFSDLELTTHGANASRATGVFWNYRILKNVQF